MAWGCGFGLGIIGVVKGSMGWAVEGEEVGVGVGAGATADVEAMRERRAKENEGSRILGEGGAGALSMCFLSLTKICGGM